MRNHPSSKGTHKLVDQTPSTIDSGEDVSLLVSRVDSGFKGVRRKGNSPALKLSTEISSYSIAIGYTSGVLLQICSIFLIEAMGSTTMSLQVAVFCIGVWWLSVFQGNPNISASIH